LPGVVRLIDFMPPRGEAADVVRIVEGISGAVPMHMDLVLRFDYGRIVPWVRRQRGDLGAIAGPDAVWLRTDAPLHGQGNATVADFTVRAGHRVPFVLTYQVSHLPRPEPVDPFQALDRTQRYWREWIGRCDYDGRWPEAVRRSLILLKALTYAPTGGILAAATTSLPEQPMWLR
jgi:GH15 family glucan-1,4-alpha-glucosidase